jgi:hypothetical protein
LSGVALAWVLFSCVFPQMRRTEPPFIGERRGSLEMCLTSIWKKRTDPKPPSRYVEPGPYHHTDVGQGGKRPPTKFWAKWGQWGCGHTMTGLDQTHLWWVASCDHCDSAHGGISWRYGDLVWVWPFLLFVWALILRVIGPLSLGLV